MQNTFSNALSKAICPHILLSGTRRETLAWLAWLIMRQGTICLWRLAAHVATAATAATTDSVRRRFYRFFQHVELDGAMTAQVVADLLGIRGKAWTLAMDRTNWEFGKTTINILMIAVIWNGVGVPLIWTLLPSAGNSNTKARTDLLDRLHEAFPDLKVAALTGDREFIGDAWMAYLRQRKIPFILRLRENQHVVREGYDTWTIADIARRLGKGEKMIFKGWCRLEQSADEGSPPVRIVVTRVPTNELLALACCGNPRRALAGYRQRWTIETLFANLKSKGFNLEDTRITAPEKLTTLLAVLALTVTLCVKTGVALARWRPLSPSRSMGAAHGRCSRSASAP
jgi:Transposase DDE domain